MILFYFFFFNDTATTEIYALSLHDALPILRGMEVADVVLEDVRVPYANTTGGEAGRGKGFQILTTEIAVGKLGISAQCVGMAQAALDESVKYAKERMQHG